jgi:broad specificity phosphatase PhoE
MQARVLETLGELNNKHTNQAVMIVAHEGVIAAFHCTHTGQDLGNHHISQGYPHDFLATFSIDAGNVGAFKKIY